MENIKKLNNKKLDKIVGGQYIDVGPGQWGNQEIVDELNKFGHEIEELIDQGKKIEADRKLNSFCISVEDHYNQGAFSQGSYYKFMTNINELDGRIKSL